MNLLPASRFSISRRVHELFGRHGDQNGMFRRRRGPATGVVGSPDNTLKLFGRA